MTVCCFSKIQMGFTFLLLAHLGCPGLRAVKRVCKRVCVMFLKIYISQSEPSNGSLCLCYEQLELWCNFNIPWLASLPCPPIFGRRGNYSKRLDMWKRENILLKEGYLCYIFVKNAKVSHYPFWGTVVDSYKLHLRGLHLSLILLSFTRCRRQQAVEESCKSSPLVQF